MGIRVSANLKDPSTTAVKVEALGVTGQGCQALTKAIEEAIGSVADRQYKPEFHQHCDQSQELQQ